MKKITRLLPRGSFLMLILVILVTAHSISGETAPAMKTMAPLQYAHQYKENRVGVVIHQLQPLVMDSFKKLAVNRQKKELIGEKEFSPSNLYALDQLEQFPTYQVVATGYTAGVESTGKEPGHPQYGITFSGVPVQRDVISTIAADIEIFPLGTLLYIPDYGYGVVADTGSAIKGNKIDLYYETVEDVFKEWGKKTVEVFVLKKGEGHLNHEMLAEMQRLVMAHP
ncbi:3D domain-containing protein [Rubeoparvulum massiliense]|uniref:3D domain-containing protein n=1 Tax=Rubeoparvulum massiliense TaxID=1631346 RepID=UPI0009776D6E|nr:3D domain-containing protein [Rubeoparvulum massiliense]